MVPIETFKQQLILKFGVFGNVTIWIQTFKNLVELQAVVKRGLTSVLFEDGRTHRG